MERVSPQQSCCPRCNAVNQTGVTTMNPKLKTILQLKTALLASTLISPIVAMPAHASPFSMFKWVVVMDHPPACQTREQMDKIVRFSFLKDYDAMSKVWDTCQEFKKGMEVEIEENPIFSDNLCARPIGYTRCLWTNKAAVKRVERSQEESTTPEGAAPRTDNDPPPPSKEIVKLATPSKETAPQSAPPPPPSKEIVKQATAPTAPPTIPMEKLPPLSIRLAEINNLARQSLPIITVHCGKDAECRKQQIAAMKDLVVKETAVAKSLRNPTTYAEAAQVNDAINSCKVMWHASEDFVGLMSCINDATPSS
jgi:hypothetical protein